MNPQKPIFRQLRVFALDPWMAAKVDTTEVNEAVLRIPWEDLEPGPVGEYVKVVDQDIFAPIKLDDPLVLATDGLAPSDGNPQFHQQMVYAVAMKAVNAIERTLGRKIHWRQRGSKYVKTVELHLHYEDMRMAYYDHGAIRFGYFEADTESSAPEMIVYTCLSQDVILHELCHAFLDTMPFQNQGDWKDNPDGYAFGCSFSNVVALLQRFSMTKLLRHQLALTRGDWTGPSQLGILAPQFGQAVSEKSGLKSAYGEFDKNEQWIPKRPDPHAYRGARKVDTKLASGHVKYMLETVFLEAVFDALNRIYRTRVSDLFRIATEGSGILPEGKLHPDLVDRLADEAAKSARHVLNMCIRALDYCPKINVTFGDFLRALITADRDLMPTGASLYPVAFVEAFRRHGIYSDEVGTLSIETLLWPRVDPVSPEAKLAEGFIAALQREFIPWRRMHDREEQYNLMKQWCRQLEEELSTRENMPSLLARIDPGKSFVKSIWPSERVSSDGEPLSQWVIEIAQQDDKHATGYTLLVDTDSGLVRYAIGKVVGAGEPQDTSEDVLKRIGTVRIPTPADRRLRVFAFDPSMASKIETLRINQVTLNIPWEELKEGPVGEYVEIVDYDPASDCFYDPVNLDHKYLIAEDGYAPSQGNPQFHQQMVYAVAMRTIRNFERSLGRLALWSSHWQPAGNGEDEDIDPERFVRRLRLYPHALREANAFYSPKKKAVLFGYFQTENDSTASPTTVFTCLSHDIIAHEVTHALLDGMHLRFREPSNPDVLALHEAFADIVALFQHFSMPEVLENQIARTRGDLASQNQLGELAQEFGRAIGNRGALRSAIGEFDEATGQWEPRSPDPGAYGRELEPHARGALLVATVFDAFLTLYRSRIADLLRIATKGTGVLPAGQLHPALVKRLASEAADSAQGVLEMCIRALDYCPPVDVTFGDYLRAIITADYEFDPVDKHNRRIAFIEAFQRHGILPEDVRAFSLEGLLWQQTKAEPGEDETIVVDLIQRWIEEHKSWNLSRDRKELFDMMSSRRAALHGFLNQPKIKDKLGFIDPDLPFEVHALRPSTRVDLQGRPHLQWIIEITQWFPGYLDANKARTLNTRMANGSAEEKMKLRKSRFDYPYRGGATLLVDAESGQVRYSIRKSLSDPQRSERQRRYMAETANLSLYATYFRQSREQEPFAVLHRF